MNAIANKVREAPTESLREVARRILDLVSNDGCLEIIERIEKGEESFHNRMCSSDRGGGGHINADSSFGERTTVLDVHGLPPPSSQRQQVVYEAKINKINACLRLPKYKGKMRIAVLTVCDIPANVAARIARETGRSLLVGNDAKVIVMSLKDKEGYSGDFKLYCKNGFSMVYPDGRSQKTHSNFILLPRTPAMSQKMEQQKMEAFRHPIVVSALQQSQPPEQQQQQQQKEILEEQFFSLEAVYTSDLQKINEDHFNADNRRRFKLQRTEEYRATKKELMLQLEELGYVLRPDAKGFVAKRQPDGVPQHPMREASPPQRVLSGRPRR